MERAAQERAAPSNRLARHLFVTATTAPPGKEVRVTGIGDRLAARRRAAWERGYGPVAAARWESALWHTLAWAFFGAGFVGAVAFAALVLRATPGNVLLVLAAGSRLSAYIGATVGEIGFLRGIWLEGSRRLAWLEDYVAAQDEHCDRAGAGAARRRASASSTSPSPIPARSAACSRTSACTSSPARWSPSWARTVPARPRS